VPSGADRSASKVSLTARAWVGCTVGQTTGLSTPIDTNDTIKLLMDGTHTPRKDRSGEMLVSHAQHVATMRALEVVAPAAARVPSLAGRSSAIGTVKYDPRSS